MDNTVGQVLAIFTGLLTVAIVALIISKNSDTKGIISAFTTGFGRDLQIALSPVSSGFGSIGGINVPGNF